MKEMHLCVWRLERWSHATTFRYAPKMCACVMRFRSLLSNNRMIEVDEYLPRAQVRRLAAFQ